MGGSLFLGVGLGWALAHFTTSRRPSTRGRCSASKRTQSSAGTTVRPAATGKAREVEVVIEYCVGCRWLLRAAWAAQELLTTFQGELKSVTLVPNDKRPGGTFDVRVSGQTVFSRKAEGRFPEMKELKQLVRDFVDPEKDLGHSDKR